MVPRLLVKVLNAVYLVGRIDGKGNAVKGLLTDDTDEASRMVGLPGGAENTVQDGLLTDGTLL